MIISGMFFFFLLTVYRLYAFLLSRISLGSGKQEEKMAVKIVRFTYDQHSSVQQFLFLFLQYFSRKMISIFFFCFKKVFLFKVLKGQERERNNENVDDESATSRSVHIHRTNVFIIFIPCGPQILNVPRYPTPQQRRFR